MGIDLATRQHQVVVLDGQGHRLTSFKVSHSREGLRELVERCSARRVGRGRGTVHFAFEATGHVWEAVGAFFEQRALRCFRHQLLLPHPYLVLTKPLRPDIQCQRGASVKIGWKYLDD